MIGVFPALTNEFSLSFLRFEGKRPVEKRNLFLPEAVENG